jgi:hypothetical protein
VGAVYVSTYKIERIEYLVHALLMPQRIQGEWFYLHMTQAILEQYVALALAKALGTTVDYLAGMYEEDEDSEFLPAAAALTGI